MLLMSRFLIFCLLALAVLPASAQERPKNVIFLVADGAGPSATALSRRVLERPLTLDRYLSGSVATTSTSHEITDSAAAATALSCGIRTFKGAIAVDPVGTPCRTVLEAAEEHGLTTGLVTTAYITDATPGSFAAHALDRGEKEAIAEQLLEQGIEVILGGGIRRFVPTPSGTRTDGRNLLDEAREQGYEVITSPAELSGASAPLMGLFAESAMQFEIDRDADVEPSLLDMTRKALSLLSESDNGFFLMIETEGTDDAGHRNDGAALAREMDSFDKVFQEAISFAEADGETLVIATSDHDTGGLGVGIGGSYNWNPEVLRRISRSANWMARRVMDEEDPVAVFAASTGIDDLTTEELEAFDAAETYREYRRVFANVVSERAGIGWSTSGHTEADVPIYSFGPSSEFFRGHLENFEVGQRLFQALGF